MLLVINFIDDQAQPEGESETNKSLECVDQKLVLATDVAFGGVDRSRLPGPASPAANATNTQKDRMRPANFQSLFGYFADWDDLLVD